MNDDPHTEEPDANLAETRRPMPRGCLIVGFGLPAILCALGAFECYRFFRMERRTHQALERQGNIEKCLKRDARFAGVNVDFYPRSNDALLVSGTVATAAELAALRQAVDSTGPADVPVQWGVLTSPRPTTATAAPGAGLR